MSQTVLITGASAFIATHTAVKVRETHKKYGDALSFAIVPDLVAPGAFDEAVKGVDGVIHTASPFYVDAKDFSKELYEPAIIGTVSVLEAVKPHNPNVKRIVITSPFAVLLDFAKGVRPGSTYTEADWNPMPIEEKTLAEKPGFEFVEGEKPNFSIATLTPLMVCGPVIHAVDSMNSLNTSSGDLYRVFNGTEKKVPPTGCWVAVDVRDVAKAHLLAYTSPAAANQRYVLSSTACGYQMMAGTIRANFPELRKTTPEDQVGQPLPDVYRLDSSKAKRDLGIEFIPFEQTVIDSVNSLRALEKSLA